MKRPSVQERAMLASDAQAPAVPPPSPGSPAASPKTGPGSMMAFMSQKSTVHAQNAKLEAQLAAFEGASPTRSIDPTLIVRSKWANRHDDSFTDAGFLSLRAEIESAGGNVQPIKVRPLAGEGGRFEIVFGHRRHQACLELGISVLAMVSEVNESDLFAEMDRENRERKDLRPYEQGMMYKRALDEGLFPSARKMASTLGVDISNLGKSLALARLPVAVLSAFSSPLDIQLRWAPDLNSALQKDPDLVLARAKEVQKQDPRPDPKSVLEYLMGGSSSEPPPKKKKVIVTGVSGQVGSINLDKEGRSAVVSFKNVDPAKLDQLEKLIQTFLS